MSPLPGSRCDPIWHVSSRSGEASANCYTPLYFTLLYFVIVVHDDGDVMTLVYIPSSQLT